MERVVFLRRSGQKLSVNSLKVLLLMLGSLQVVSVLIFLVMSIGTCQNCTLFKEDIQEDLLNELTN